MLGGNPPGRAGNILHTRLFYYDPVRSRPGLPERVAALVERIEPAGVHVRLVNLDPVEARSVVVQAGAYGEHEFTEVRSGRRCCAGRREPVQGSLGAWSRRSPRRRDEALREPAKVPPHTIDGRSDWPSRKGSSLGVRRHFWG